MRRGENNPFLDMEVFDVLVKKRGLSLEEIGQRLGYKNNNFKNLTYKLRRGKQKLPVSKLEKLAGILGCDVDLLELTPQDAPEEMLATYKKKTDELYNRIHGSEKPSQQSAEVYLDKLADLIIAKMEARIEQRN